MCIWMWFARRCRNRKRMTKSACKAYCKWCCVQAPCMQTLRFHEIYLVEFICKIPLSTLRLSIHNHKMKLAILLRFNTLFSHAITYETVHIKSIEGAQWKTQCVCRQPAAICDFVKKCSNSVADSHKMSQPFLPNHHQMWTFQQKYDLFHLLFLALFFYFGSKKIKWLTFYAQFSLQKRSLLHKIWTFFFGIPYSDGLAAWT